MKIIILIIVIFLGITDAQSQDVRSQLRQIANDLAKQIETKGKKRVVIASFLDLKNQETELGRYMADKFSIGMSMASSLEITDRSQLTQLLRDNKLGAERILDPRTIPSLGKITGAEVIITGNYTALDNSVDITVKAIELERGLRLAVAEGTIPRISEINKLLGDVSSNSSFIENNENGNSENTQADVDKKCSTNHTGSYCFENKLKLDIKIWMGSAQFIVHPGQTECLYGVDASSKGEYTYQLYVYRDAKEGNYETRQIVVSECKKKTFVVR